MILKKGVIIETVNDTTKAREMTENEIKGMLGHLRFNTGMSLPDQLIHDFMSESRILPTFKKCMHFNREDFKNMVEPLKPRKKLPKAETKVKTRSRAQPKRRTKTRKRV